MRVIGTNWLTSVGSAVSVQGSSILGAYKEPSIELPITSIKNLKDTYKDFDYLAYCDTLDIEDHKYDIKKVTKAELVKVSYKNALAMSSISLNNWDRCAVMIVDPYYCSLGWFDSGKFYWLKDFIYPNSIELFYAASCRFLGFDPLKETDNMQYAALGGKPLYADWLEEILVDSTDEDYKLKINIESGFSTIPTNNDVASSVQQVYSKVLLALATWLNKEVKSTRLAFAGSGSSNFIAATEIKKHSGYAEILINPASKFSASLGAASLVSRPLFKTSALGAEGLFDRTPNDIAKDLYQGKIVAFNQGKEEFSNNSLINRNYLMLPSVSDDKEYFTLCQEKNCAKYFNGPVSRYGSFLAKSDNLKFSKNNLYRVVSVTPTSHPVINMVLEILASHGYPVLKSSPII